MVSGPDLPQKKQVANGFFESTYQLPSGSISRK